MDKLKYFADSHIHCRIFDYDVISKMLDSIEELGVTHVSLLSLPYRSVAEDLALLYAKINYNKMCVRVFGGLHDCDRYATIPYEIQAEKLIELGCDGIKIMCDPVMRSYLGYGLNNEKFDNLFAYLNKNKIPVNIHLADPSTFWNRDKSLTTDKPVFAKGVPSYEQFYEEAFCMLDKNPGLKVVFAHFMFLSDSPQEAVRVMEKYPNLYFDLTPGMEMYENFGKDIEFWNEFFEKYSNRILFGTDSNTIKKNNDLLNRIVYRALTNDSSAYTENCYGRDFNIRGLHLSDETVDKICYTNYIDFVGESPKEVNIELWKKYCEKIIDDIESNPDDEYYKRSYELVDYHCDDPYQQTAVDFCKNALLQKMVE